MFLHDSLQDSKLSILVHVAIWVLLGSWIFFYCRRKEGGTIGIPVSYIGLLSMLHFGATIYLLPWYDPRLDAYLRDTGVNIDEVAAGFALSTVGVGGFALGIYLSEKLFYLKKVKVRVQVKSVESFGRKLVLFGVVCFFVIFPIAGRLPSGAALASAGVNLVVVGLCLLTFNALKMRVVDRIRILAATLSLPSVTMVIMGFVGYGISAIANIAFFMTSFVKARWWHPFVGMVLFWFALSFYITYMDARGAIRDVVWKGAKFTDRIQVVVERFSDAKLFSVWDINHLHFIDSRLNQNALVGRSIYYMDRSKKEFAKGETMYVAATAWIPRLVWPGKPVFGGSGTLVAQYTGLAFSSTTSVGVGQVLEFYINFGEVGVFCGFVVMGAVLRYLDKRAAARLYSGEYWDYSRVHLMGVCALQPGGVLAEPVASCAAAWVLMIFVRQYFASRPNV